MQTLYTTSVKATSGREGKVLSADGILALDLAFPKELGGPGGSGTNPEQLFAAGYAACFGSALGLVAKQQKVDVSGVTITAQVSLGKTDDGGFGLAVELHGDFPNTDAEIADKLMHAAHELCPYSRATRGNIPVTLSV